MSYHTSFTTITNNIFGLIKHYLTYGCEINRIEAPTILKLNFGAVFIIVSAPKLLTLKFGAKDVEFDFGAKNVGTNFSSTTVDQSFHFIDGTISPSSAIDITDIDTATAAGRQ